MRGEPGLSVTNPGHRTYALDGELDLVSGPTLVRAVTSALTQPGDLLLDLRDLTFVDSTGVHVLLKVAEEIRGDLILLHPSENVARILSVMQVERIPNVQVRHEWAPSGRSTDMKAFAIDELEGPGSLRDLPVPEPAQGQVRIRVAAGGLNPFDNAVVQGYLKDRMEHRFPLVPGMDGSGTVDALGAGVDAWAVGDEVFGSVGKAHLGEGTLAQFVTMSAGTLARKPPSLEHGAAAAIPTGGATALIMADALALAQGHTVVTVGATGGVGSYFVQLASKRGARVVAVCREQNADYARSLGADDVIDYTAGDLAEAVRSRYPDGIDAVADMHGDREALARLAEQVRTGGHVASAVGAADPEAVTGRGIRATNVMGRVATESLETLSGLMERGEMAAPEIRSFSLADAGEALAAVATGHTRGKIVVTVV